MLLDRRMNRKLARWSSFAVAVMLFICVFYQTQSVIYFEQNVSQDPNPLDDEFTHAYFKPGNEIITPIDEQYIINGENICSTISPKSVIVLIPAVAKDTDTRNLLRRTWLGALLKNEWPNDKLDYEFRAAFIFGKGVSDTDNQGLKMENSVYGDIVQGSFVDSYYNLTRKTLFGLKWVNNFCSSAQYVLKIDVDTFAHIPKLFRKIAFYNDKPGGKIFGRLWEKSEPHRDGKWKIEENVYPPIKYYPPYCDGPIYVISVSAVPRLVYTSERMPYLHLEDVFVTGIVAKIAKVNRINVLQNVDFRNLPEWVCSFRVARDDFPIHLADSDYSQEQIDDIWKCMKDGPTRDDYLKYYYSKFNFTWLKILLILAVILTTVLLVLLK